MRLSIRQLKALGLTASLFASCSGSTQLTSIKSVGSGENGPAEAEDADEQNGGDAKSAGGEGKGRSGQKKAKPPQWINGSYLTCQWKHLAPDEATRIGCKVPQDALSPEADPKTLRWDLEGANGEPLPHTVPDGSDKRGRDAQFIVTARKTPTAKVIIKGTSLPVFKKELAKALPGFEDGSLASCLGSDEAADICFDDAGVVFTDGSMDQNSTQPPQSKTRETFSYQGVNYHLGFEGESCVEACTDFGGVHDATINVIGSAGTRENCQAVLQGLAGLEVPVSNPGTMGYGCIIDRFGDGRHVESPATTQDSWGTYARRVCACQN